MSVVPASRPVADPAPAGPGLETLVGIDTVDLDVTEYGVIRVDALDDADVIEAALAVLRAEDSSARHGGGVVAFLPGASLAVTARIADRVRAAAARAGSPVAVGGAHKALRSTSSFDEVWCSAGHMLAEAAASGGALVADVV